MSERAIIIGQGMRALPVCAHLCGVQQKVTTCEHTGNIAFVSWTESRQNREREMARKGTGEGGKGAGGMQILESWGDIKAWRWL